jgi:hypothetical protein
MVYWHASSKSHARSGSGDSNIPAQTYSRKYRKAASEDKVTEQERLFAVACAKRVAHLTSDASAIEALNVAERYARGQATREALARVLENATRSYVRTGRAEIASLAATAAETPYEAAVAAGQYAISTVLAYASATKLSRKTALLAAQLEEKFQAAIRKEMGL